MGNHGLTISRGALVGGIAGSITAIGDFGASWLWLPWWRDCVLLLLRLITTQVAAGVVLGAVLGALFLGCDRFAARASTDAGVRRKWPVPLVLALAPALAEIAYLLFTGGKMSRIPGRPIWVVVSALGLIGASYATLRIGRALLERIARASRRQAGAAAVVVLGVHFALTKLDQNVLPNLYAYLHASLSAAAWITAALAVLIMVPHWINRRRPQIGIYAIPIAILALAINMLTLAANPNVQVALFDHRAATSRSLMQGLELMFSTAGDDDARSEQAEAARRARDARARQSADGLPTYEGPHLLLITIDALRADRLGAYGYERGISPEIDALSREGVVFEHAYAPAPHSSYSLSSVMTSEYLHETLTMGHALPEETIATAANAGECHTAAFFTLGIFHTEGALMSRYHDNAYGFTRREHADVLAAEKTDQVLDEVDRLLGEGEPPTLFWVHYFDVHEPYLETSLGTSDSDRYDSEIVVTDREVGRLVREMRERLQRPIIIAISADHGEEFRDHGGVYHGSTLYEEQIRVPLIVSAPDLEARRVVAPVETIDLAPTLLALAGIEVPAAMRGDDLRPLLIGRDYDIGPAFASVMNKRMVVQWPYKLIADLRFNLFELYHLENDPRERENLASREPERLEALKGEVYAWLDSLEDAEAEGDPVDIALRRGRLGDRRAVEPLAEAINRSDVEVPTRCEAAQILGKLADRRAAPALVEALDDEESLVAAEAAIALGRMFDDRARASLHQLIYNEDPDLRTRAAVSLARLRDPAAVPGLLDALWVAEERYEREEAIRWLGRLRDPRAVDPLLNLLPDERLRYLVVIALGQIGDDRAFEPLVGMLEWAHHASVRDNVVRALGDLGNAGAIPHLERLAAEEPDLKNTGESLVRLDAIAAQAIGGTDIGPGLQGRGGLSRCQEGPLYHDWNYRNRTVCETDRASISIPLFVPEALRSGRGSVVVLLRAKRLDAPTAAGARIRIGDLDAPFSVDGEWGDVRLELSRSTLTARTITAELTVSEAGTRLLLDHLLLIPRDTPGGETEGSRPISPPSD